MKQSLMGVIEQETQVFTIANKLIKRVAHELVKVGSEASVSLYVIRYSGNEAYKDQMLNAFQMKWNQKLERNRPVCELCNKESDLITETEKGSEVDEFGRTSDQEIGEKEGDIVGIQGESEVILGGDWTNVIFRASNLAFLTNSLRDIPRDKTVYVLVEDICFGSYIVTFKLKAISEKDFTKPLL